MCCESGVELCFVSLRWSYVFCESGVELFVL